MYPRLSKAEMLSHLAEAGFPAPPLTYFSLGRWRADSVACLADIAAGPAAHGPLAAVRSSSLSEDGEESSLAGAYHSVLNVPVAWPDYLSAAVNEVAASLDSDNDQILVQTMVENVSMSGVVMTRGLDDGAPYYAVNYDDVSGRTDTVTSGRGVSKTVQVHRGVRDDDFDSPRLLAVITLARRLEELFGGEPLDIEFAVDEDNLVHLLQVRRICTLRHWPLDMEEKVDRRIGHVAGFVDQLMTPRRGLYGRKTILAMMPDWNPAEMIGAHPRPLPLSLYRELITRRTWSRAREMMGYRPLPPVELMVAVGGRPYIDVRASFNSFLPAGLPDETGEKLVNAWLDRLDHNPAFHDKVEFEIVHTVAEPDFEESFRSRYGDILSGPELADYRRRLIGLTAAALNPEGTLAWAMGEIEKLENLQASLLASERQAASGLGEFDLALRLAEALEQCRILGTEPFAVAARHGFIAETWLRAAVRRGVLTADRADALRRSIKTVSSELTRDFREVIGGRMDRASFLNVYGHLRPGAYDPLSPSYRERDDLFDVPSSPADYLPPEPGFDFTANESRALEELLAECGQGLGAAAFLEYVRSGVAGRERAKFVFTRHLDHILHLAAAWGGRYGFSLEEVTLLPIGDIVSSAFQPLPLEGREYYRGRMEAAEREYALGRTFKLSYLIRSPHDVYIVPQHRSEPNFITRGLAEAPVVRLDGVEAPNLDGAIVCIESADPGYDWIFTRNIAGLVTRFGGSNSHMAIRCAEYGLPAAIGCGELLFDKAASAEILRLDCSARTVTPVDRPPHQAVAPAVRLGASL